MCPIDRRVPSEIMDQRHLCMASTSSSFFSDKFDLMSERQVGFWKQSSLPSYRVKTATSDGMYMHFVTPDGSNIREDGPLESLKEIENQTVGNLLPDEDELFSGIIDDIEHDFQSHNAATPEYTLFCREVELEADDSLISNKILSPASGPCLYHHETPGAPFLMEHVYVDHPTRMLLVRNIDRKVEVYELRTLFEKFGDMHTLDTSFKDHGFVIISYYDVRSSCNAMNALQSRQLKQRKLYIQFIIPKDNQSEGCSKQGMLMLFNLDASISNDDLHQMFGIYGDIKEIHETPHQHQHKSIEFYDVRAAEDALCALSKDETRQKHVKHECNNPGGSGRCVMQQLSSNLQQAEIDVCHEETYPSRSLPFEYAPVDLGVIMSYNNNGEPLPDVQSTTHAPYNPVVNSKFGEILSNTQHQLALRNRISPVSKYFSQIETELNNMVGKVNLGSDSISTPYSHSLSRHHDGIPGIPLRSPSTLSPASINVNFRSPQTVDDTLIYSADSCQPKSLPYEYENSGAFGTKENRSCPPYTQQCFWGNSNLHYRSQEQTTWPDPSLFNNISAPLTQIHGLPRSSSPMLSTVRPLHRHHVGGSAPGFSHSLWYRRHAYAVDAANGSKSHPGALGSMGYSGCPTPHLPKLTSPNIFPRRGNSIDALISPHLGLASLQEKCHMFHGRTSPTLLPASYDANDRVRSRRSDANPNHADNNKQYELDIERIIREEDSRTTLMIKNIPNKYTSKMLLAAIDEHHRGTYDFIYLPIDFKNKCNVGYAFINMTDPEQIIPFFKTFNGKKWERFNSEKVVSLTYARIQGKAALISHFQNSSLMNEDKRCRPIIFHTDGPNAGDQEPFPTGVNVRSKPGRPRTSSSSRRRGETHQRSPPSTPSSSSSGGGGEAAESSSGTDSSSSSPK